MNSIALQAAVALENTKLAQLIAVLFGNDTVILVEHDAQPYVVMKPLVTSLGLDWRSQHVKLLQKFGATVVEIPTVAEDGKLRNMTCLSLRTLPGWLQSLTLAKIREDLRPKVKHYQDESIEFLWRYWTGTYLPQYSAENVTLNKLRQSTERDLTKIIVLLGGVTELGTGQALYDQYARYCRQLDAKAMPMIDMTPGLAQKRLAFQGGAA